MQPKPNSSHTIPSDFRGALLKYFSCVEMTDTTVVRNTVSTDELLDDQDTGNDGSSDGGMDVHLENETGDNAEEGEQSREGARFKSWEEFQAALENWQRTTFHAFVIDRSINLPATSRMSQTLRRNYVWYDCVHHKGYKPHKTGARPYTHTRASNCPSHFRIAARVNGGYLEVR